MIHGMIFGNMVNTFMNGALNALASRQRLSKNDPWPCDRKRGDKEKITVRRQYQLFASTRATSNTYKVYKSWHREQPWLHTTHQRNVAASSAVSQHRLDRIVIHAG